ncbi:unnamed protein product [Sympodiomycopsis kandeliae]
MSTRTSSSRRESRYTDRPRRASQVEVRRDAAGDEVDEDEGVAPELRDNTVIDTRRRAAGGDDDDEEEEEQVSNRRAKRSRRNVTATQESRGNQGVSGSQDADEEEELPGPQPLNENSLPILKALAHSYGSVVSTSEKTKAVISEAAVLMAEINEKVTDTGEHLDEAFCQVIDAIEEAKIRKAAMENVHDKVSRNQDVTDPVSIYKAYVDEHLTKYKNQTSRQKYLHREEYTGFKEQIWEAYNTTAMPPLIEQIPVEEGDNEQDEDDDFAVGGTILDFKCPITMAILENPVTCKKCKHSYSKEAMPDYFARQATVTCPKAGCVTKMSKSDLFDDKALAKRVQGYKRRLLSRNETRSTQTAIID